MNKLLMALFLIFLNFSLYAQDGENDKKDEQKKELTKTEKFILKITHPIEGKSFKKGEIIPVLWEYENGKDENLLLYLQVSTNFGLIWETVEGSAKLKDKKKEWTIKCESTKLCQLRLTNDTNYDKFKGEIDTKFDFRSGVFEIKNNGSNFAIVSAVKSIAGTKPSFEFIDINFNFSLFKNVSILAGIDVAMTDDTSNAEGKKKITESGIFVNFNPKQFRNENRALNIGPFVKIFNAVPYYGFQLGSMEIGGLLESSYLIVGFARRMFHTSNYTDTTNTLPEEFQDNFYIEFGLYSEKLGLPLKYLRIKGGVLIPAWYSKGFDRVKSKDIISRIALEIPLGGLFKFD